MALKTGCSEGIECEGLIIGRIWHGFGSVAEQRGAELSVVVLFC